MTSDDRGILIKLGLRPEELAKIDQIEAPLCQTARILLARIFKRALVGKDKKLFAEILSACGQEWQEVWSRGTPGRLGDPDDVTTLGPIDHKKPAKTQGWKNTLAF